MQSSVECVVFIDCVLRHRFTHLRSLNLADNNLLQFPMSLCEITTLVELNIASNKLTEIPPEIQQLSK